MRYFSSLILSLVMTACATAGQAATSLIGNSESISIQIVVAQATTSELRDTPIPRPTKPKQRLTEGQSFKVAQFVNTCAAYDYFVQNYPTGQFVRLARKWMKQNCRPKLTRGEPPLPTVKPAKQRDAGNQPRLSTTPRSRSSKKSPTKVIAVPRPAPSNASPTKIRARKSSEKKRARAARSRTTARKSTATRISRRRKKKCRRETELECIKRGGEAKYGSCDTVRICE